VRRYVVSAMLLMLVAAGCGGGDSTTSLLRAIPIIKSTTTATRSTAASGAAEANAAPPPGRPPHRPSSKPHVFQTPSGNIGCGMTTEYLICSIRETDWTPPGDPNCPASAGRWVTFNAGTAPTVACGMPEPPFGSVLSYGDAASTGPFDCVSRQNGLLCSDHSRHGFMLSRGRVVVR
jgi:hypothetical protein